MDGPVGIIEPFQDRRLHRVTRFPEPSFRDANSRHTDIARGILQCRCDCFRLNGIETVKRPERVKPGSPVGGSGSQFHEIRNDTARPTLDEQPLRRVSPPPVRVRQRVDELRG